MLAHLSKTVRCAPSTFIKQNIFFSASSNQPSVHPSVLSGLRLCHTDTAPQPQTFASLMRNCKITNMGDPVGKTVIGRIYHVVGEDLYIDFGHKFGCVCTKPRLVFIILSVVFTYGCVGRGGGSISGAPRWSWRWKVWSWVRGSWGMIKIWAY